MLEIRKVDQKDKEYWFSLDIHISDEEFNFKVSTKTGYIIWGHPVPVPGKKI